MVQSRAVPAGFSAHVVPSALFGNVALDSQFTGAASRGPDSPYFSQLDNLADMVLISTPYAPDPVRERVVFVTISVHPADLQSLLVAPALATPVALDPPKTKPGARAVSRASGDVATISGLSLADVTSQLRAAVDLPVQDIARMAGIGRRQYYNLLKGKAEAMKRTAGEQRLRLVHQQVAELAGVCQSPAQVRAALLMPLAGQQRRSYFDVAETGDTDGMHAAFDELRALVATGEPVEDRLPPSGTFAPGDERWAEAEQFVRGYRPGE